MSEQDGPDAEQEPDAGDPEASGNHRRDESSDGPSGRPADERGTEGPDEPSDDSPGSHPNEETTDDQRQAEDERHGSTRKEDESPASERGETQAEDSAEDSVPEQLVAAVAEQRGVSLDPGEIDPGSAGQATMEAVESASTDELARVLVALVEQLAMTERTLTQQHERAEELESRLRRKQADFENYKKRQEKRLEEEKARATEELVERLLDVRDNLSRALDQDKSADIRGGVESTLEAFDRELERENVESIEPSVGTAVDPNRHEVLATTESDQPEDVIAELYRPGYEMAGKVLRPAQVTVSEGADDDGEDGETEETV